jgi:hypothetical protein
VAGDHVCSAYIKRLRDATPRRAFAIVEFRGCRSERSETLLRNSSRCLDPISHVLGNWYSVCDPAKSPNR